MTGKGKTQSRWRGLSFDVSVLFGCFLMWLLCSTAQRVVPTRALPSIQGDAMRLLHAAGASDTQRVRELLSSGVPADAMHKDDMTALMLAARWGHTDTVEVLLDNGANPNARFGDEGWTALMVAAEGGRTPTVKLLLEKGADVNAKNNDGQTALMWAAEQGYFHTVEVLIDGGADVNVKDKHGKTALTLAKEQECFETFRLLKTAGAKE
jgi:hypothetical protein